MKLETDRLLIRDYVKEDLEMVHQLVQSPEIYEHQSWGPNSFEDSKNHVGQCLQQQMESPRQSFEFCITDRSTKEIIGAIGLRIRSSFNRSGDLGYWIRRDLWGHGLATEATQRIIQFGFDDLNMNRLWATASTKNLASLRVLQKAGMQREGLMRQDILVRGQFRDSVLMSILKSDSRLSKG